MTVLLDEYLPRRLKYCLSGCDCQTVPEMGCAGKDSGDLLAPAIAAVVEAIKPRGSTSTKRPWRSAAS